MESMNAQSSMAHNARTMQTKRVKWKDINWIIAESYVNRLQVRIVKAVQKDKWRLVKRLQKLITNSFYAKAIAVKRVITNKGKHTPGIDKVVWETDEDKSVDQHIIIWHFRRIKLCRNNAGIFHPRTPGILVITVIEKIITVITRLKMGYFNFPDSANYGIK